MVKGDKTIAPMVYVKVGKREKAKVSLNFEAGDEEDKKSLQRIILTLQGALACLESDNPRPVRILIHTDQKDARSDGRVPMNVFMTPKKGRPRKKSKKR